MRGTRWLPLVAVLLLLVGCGSADRRAAPPATPQHVVAAYFAAANAHDEARARPLVTRGFGRLSFEGGCLFDGCAKITRLRTAKPRYTHNAYGYVAHVGTSFVFDIEENHSREGINTTYCLVRKGAGDAWRIDDEGDC